MWIMSARRVTIVDLAAELGLSKTTVSDALHGRGRVAPETVEQVREAAAALGYVGNRAAQQLRGNRVGAVGLYIPPVVRSFAFYMEFVFGAVAAAGENGIDLVVLTRDEEALRSRPPAVDGIIAIDPLPGDRVLAALASLSVPLVTAGRPLDPEELAADGTIEVGYPEHVHELLDRGLARGLTRPALLLPDQQFHSSFAEDVVIGYRGWCAEHGIEPWIRELPLHPSIDRLTSALEELVAASDPDIVLCGYQGLAGRLLAPLERIGKRPGPDFELVSLVGDPVTELGDERITSLDVRPTGFGRASVLLLRDLLAGTVEAPASRTHEAAIPDGTIAVATTRSPPLDPAVLRAAEPDHEVADHG